LNLSSIGGAVIEPVAHAQCEEVLATVHGLGVETEMLQGRTSQALQFYREHPEFIQRMIFQGIGGKASFAQIPFFEAVGVHDQNAVGLQVADIHLQRGRIHSDQHIDRVAGSMHFARREIQLKAADPGLGAGRGADFGGIVRKSGDVVAVEGDGIGELAAGNLHAVAGITGETYDGLLDDLALGLPCGYIHKRRHGDALPP